MLNKGKYIVIKYALKHALSLRKLGINLIKELSIICYFFLFVFFTKL